MKFLINATNLKSGGALQVARSLLQAWQKSARLHEFHVVTGPALQDLDTHDSNIQIHRYAEHPKYLRPGAKRFRQYMHNLEKKTSPDAALTVFGPSLWKPLCPHLCGFANGIYLFDTDDYIAYQYPQWSVSRLQYRIYRHLLLRTLAQNADAFWLETDTAAEALRQTYYFKDKEIYVIGNTYPHKLQVPEKDRISHPARLLFLSAYYPHKNFEIFPKIIEALVRRKIQVTFVLTLPEEKFAQIRAQSVHKEYLANMGPVAPDQLASAYSDCDFVFIPSLLETFSSNFPEAMLCGKPIMCADRPYARRLCGDAALYFDPHDPGNAAIVIERLLSDAILQENLRQSAYRKLKEMETPDSRAEKILHLLIHLAKQFRD